jgi:hypothetical protein
MRRPHPTLSLRLVLNSYVELRYVRQSRRDAQPWAGRSVSKGYCPPRKRNRRPKCELEDAMMSFKGLPVSDDAQHGRQLWITVAKGGTVAYRMADPEARFEEMTARDARQQIGDHHKAVILTCQSYHMSPMIHHPRHTYPSWQAIPSDMQPTPAAPVSNTANVN